MAEILSPLGEHLRAGRHANSAAEIGVVLSETAPGSIVQLAVWPGMEAAAQAVISKVLKLKVGNAPGAGAASGESAAFGIAPGRWLLVDADEGLAGRLAEAVPASVGSVTDLSHGRTALRIEGDKAAWVLAKFFAVDFSPAKFPVGNGVATNHHDIFAQVQRSGDQRFDIYVFRSFARSFWNALCHAAEETGYEIR
ncbi:MAG: sarcosine oxidase subunit gamma family protein [Rhizobiaceae bacterium]|nr:sarcosine oxidase subunit gamma family protein [Rhizobiaceae bacterium]